MNVVFVHRKKIQGRYSLENVFNSLIPYLKKKHNFDEEKAKFRKKSGACTRLQQDPGGLVRKWSR